MNQIITSILDTDLYKISMGQYALHQYPKAYVKYEFVCRNKDVKLGFFKDKVQEQINYLVNLKLTAEEQTYLKTIPFLSSDYIDFLSKFKFDTTHVFVKDDNGNLIIEINGKWVDTILYEVPVLAIVNELYFKETSDFDAIRENGEKNLRNKIDLIRQHPDFRFTDFGTRRRYSKAWQEYVVKTLKNTCPQLMGTSNVKLAMDLGLKAMGTQAHEIFSAHLALVDDIRQAQKRTFYTWLEEFGTNNLGTALSDTFTTKAFFKDFDLALANNFNSVRQDSGDPFEFGYKMIEHYKKLGIDPKTKSIIFSDGLTVSKAIEIYKEFNELIGVSFGIGTSLTNDLSVKPLNIVIKLTECNNVPVAKLSDDITKAIGNKEMIEKIKKIYDIN